MGHDPVGRAFTHGLRQGPVWRFGAMSPEVASAVAGLLGGVPCGGEDGWEVVTAVSALRVHVTSATEAALCFQLAEVPGLGSVRTAVQSWGLAAVLGVEAGALARLPDDSMPWELAVRAVDFTTLTGQIFRCAAPSLARCA